MTAETAEERIPEPLEEVFRAVVAEEKEVSTRLHVGSGVWSVVMSPLYKTGELRGAVAVLRDVTEEAKLQKLRKDFVANVSHELRTPLSMLQGYSEALLDDIASTPEERMEIARVINEESLRMGRLVHDLLDLARLEAGRLELNEAEARLEPLLQRVQRKFAGVSRERDIAFNLEILSPPEALVLESADEDKLEQVLINLLDNAFRHTPSGGIITLSAASVSLEQGPAVTLSVKDNGSGIPEEDVPYVFERFYKADKSRKRATGTGIGLAIVKNLVESHRGAIEVQSRIGQGTTFTVTLPVQADAVVVESRR